MEVKKFIKKNASTILTGIGTVGFMATSVLTVKSTIKAIDILNELEEKSETEVTTLDKVIATIPVYIPPILFGIGTLSCFLGANILNKRSQASLISAYGMIDRSFKEYKVKVNDIYGEEADKKVRHEIAKENRPRRLIKA